MLFTEVHVINVTVYIRLANQCPQGGIMAPDTRKQLYFSNCYSFVTISVLSSKTTSHVFIFRCDRSVMPGVMYRTGAGRVVYWWREN